MTTKTTSILVLLMIAVAVIAGALLWNQLPEQMASHWNINDEVDGYISKFWGVFLMPLVVLGMFGLFIALPNMDPLKANIESFRSAFNLFILLITVFMLYIHGLTLAWSLGNQSFKMSTMMLPFMGILFIFIGYLLRQAKRNFFIGIRTPWTLSSDSVWDKTHQLGSVLFMVSGALAFVGSFFGGMAAFWLLFVPLMGSTLALVIYSYILYRSETKA
ncbi:MAG: SdpI family protein [Anaerolineales bacterium]|uniref:SdpI family protein n=1 Tax=Candidatus Villigracilis vicinus TaxID=3140679 RepID=UPI0031352F02|nr:SdpI family protein [Anaerolineales bacterium]